MKKRIIVIGGGVAGMQTALRLAEQGVEPVIVEKEPELGGKLRGWHVLFPSFTPAEEILTALRRRVNESGIEVLTVPGRGFVELVEADREATPEAEACVRAVVEPMLERGADQIVLGCTHYPFLLPVLRRVVAGREVTIVDPSPAVARRVANLLDAYSLRAESGHTPSYTFRTFADEAYRRRLEHKALAGE